MPRSLLSIYPRKTDRFDEMLAADGEVRAPWRPFFDHLNAGLEKGSAKVRARLADRKSAKVEAGQTGQGERQAR